MKVTVRFLRDRRRSLFGWSLGIAGMILLSTGFYPSIKNQPSFDEVLANLPDTFQAMIGAQARIAFTSPPGYLHGRLFSNLLPMLLVIFGVALGARAIGGSEDDGTLELLLANPVTRGRVVLERYAAVVGLLVAVSIVMTVVLLATAAPFGLLDGVSPGRLVEACVAATCLALLHASIAFAVGCIVGTRSASIATGATVAVAGYLLFGLVVADVLAGLRFLSPWWWYLSRNIIAGGLPPEAVAAPIGLSLIVVTAGAWRFQHRDLR